MRKQAIGVCVGASTIKAVVLDEIDGKITIRKKIVRGHESNPRDTFLSVLSEAGYNDCDYFILTGRKFRELIDAESITEPEALENAIRYCKQTGSTIDHTALVSLGAETFIVYILDNGGNVVTLETGNKCASGTGAFFLQQIRRMDISLEEAVALSMESESHQVSGRCSVFCKSDCTHALNRGIPIGQVTAGLCRMMADKILDLLEKVPRKRILAVGGVTCNSSIMKMIRDRVEVLDFPHCADAFEALGAAYYALVNKTAINKFDHEIDIKRKHSFDILAPLSVSADKVRFEQGITKPAEHGDVIIIGLDVGSTTTKAVALRTKDDAIVASVYLRTNGNPVKASRECYRALSSQINADVIITGLGTTGSGRQISGLHAGTEGVINEIVAHATAATYFDAEVDTIFEIGGQDAKYTYLVNGVPCDYAMNEACSAGTGSFLEESAKESLGLDCTEIQDIAIAAKSPPNFNDQCAAFISSDIKTAVHDGIGKEDIIAGLVYSICMNYVNRVKGQRPIGKKIFMQGGVCYNKAVPLAMASLIGREIIVPPEPGLMGAFGVALEVKNRIERGHLDQRLYDLGKLSARDITFGKEFVCAGGTSKCDRACAISLIVIDGRQYPFGGACNRYYNMIHQVRFDSVKYDYVKIRQNLIFQEEVDKKETITQSVGMNRTFLMNELYPLFSTFFKELGFKVVLSDNIDEEGMKRRRSSFCYPGELAHGSYYNLILKKTDFIFLPAIIELFVENATIRRPEHQCTCLMLQSEPYFLKSAFKEIPSSSKVISPTIDFAKGFENQLEAFVEVASQMNRSRLQAIEAFGKAVDKQEQALAEMRRSGEQFLENLEKEENQYAIVLFGRPYNAFAKEANFGIPEKFASRGVPIIPWDFLPYDKESFDEQMCWALGQNLLRASRIVARTPKLFGVYITNFSCGPDSFLISYFRDIMKSKPSLTLEFDSHTADAGVNTRIEAYLDIIERHLHIHKKPQPSLPFTAADIVMDKRKPVYISSEGERLSLTDPRVHLLFPSMGRLSTESIVSVFQGAGIRSTALPVYDFETLKIGRANASCKECLPLILTSGSLLKYVGENRENEHIAYFMPTCGGNCRFTQYSVFIRKMIDKQHLKNIALLTLTNENGYAGLALHDALNVIKATIISDCMEDIYNALFVLAKDKEDAIKKFNLLWNRILVCFKEERGKGIYNLLDKVATELKTIALRFPLDQAPSVSLHGEIFVRRDYFSCQDLIERLAKRDIVVKRAHVMEWLSYCDYNVEQGIYQAEFDWKGKLEFKARMFLQNQFEQKIKKTLARSGLYKNEKMDMATIMRYGSNFFDERFTGEAIIIAGSFFKDILHSNHGTISIGPFACMPARVIEAVLSAESTMEVKQLLDKRVEGSTAYENSQIERLPFLSIETDGNPFPQVIEARIEAFGLQVERLHKQMQKHGIG